MTFTYSLGSSDSDTANIAKVRLEIGDTSNASGAGVKPDGTNLSDEEIAIWLEREGDEVMRAVASACEALARQWSRVADIAVGPRREALGQVSKRWADEAKRLREQYGGAGEECFSIGAIRVDGFSNEDANDAVEATGSDYEGDFTYVRPA